MADQRIAVAQLSRRVRPDRLELAGLAVRLVGAGDCRQAQRSLLGDSFRIGRISRFLVIFEIALSCGLLVAAGLMIKSVSKLRSIDFGFAPQEVFTARVGLPESDYPEGADQIRFFDRASLVVGARRGGGHLRL